MNTFTVPELVPILHLKQRAIRQLIADGQLRGRLVGRQYLITEAALKAFLEENEAPEEERPSYSVRW